MQKTQSYQDAFLNAARRDRTPVTVFLMNGFQMKGIIRGFDSFVVLLDSDGRQQMIYKHVLSTITPSVPINLFQDAPEL
ncbi:MAG: RNA chaperone Hfq [Oscillospiraceae bacterium]|nr:RNA chaperone Hfq [Oscillospiraceae bacterium]MCD8253962.1 RNA chaperone Hfq [Oscillospiraceae bacterium]